MDVTVDVGFWVYTKNLKISYRSKPNISAVLLDGADPLIVRTRGNTRKGIVRYGAETVLQPNDSTSLSMPDRSDALDYDHFELEFYNQDVLWSVCAGTKVNGCAPISYEFSLRPDGNATLDSHRSEYGLHIVLAVEDQASAWGLRLINQNSGEVLTFPIEIPVWPGATMYTNGYIPIYGLGQTKEGDTLVLQAKWTRFSDWQEVGNTSITMPPWDQGGQYVLTFIKWDGPGGLPTGSAGELAPPWYYGNNCSRYDDSKPN